MELEVQKFLRSGGTLADLDVAALPDLPTPRVREYPLRTLEEVMAAVEAIAPFSGEGVVMRDAAYRRVKIKSAAYPYSGVLFWLHSGVEVGE